MSRKLKAGTIVNLAGSNLPMVLNGDSAVSFAGDGVDATFIGHLHKNATNFKLNAPDVGNGKWNPHTAAAMLSECDTCGREIAPDAENQKTCAGCLQVAAAAEAEAENAKASSPKAKKTAKKKVAKKK